MLYLLIAILGIAIFNGLISLYLVKKLKSTQKEFSQKIKELSAIYLALPSDIQENLKENKTLVKKLKKDLTNIISFIDQIGRVKEI